MPGQHLDDLPNGITMLCAIQHPEFPYQGPVKADEDKPQMLNIARYSIALVAISALSASAFADTYPVSDFVDVRHYRFSLTLSDQSDQIDGTANITVHLMRSDIDELRLDLANVQEGRGMIVHAVSHNDKQLRFKHENNKLAVELPKTGDSPATIDIQVDYSGAPRTGLIIGDNKHGDRTFFSDNWPDKARQWLPTVDHISDKATSEFLVIAPGHYQVISNGLLQESSTLSDGRRFTHWKQSVPTSPWLYVLGVARFAVQHVDEFDGKSIQTWVYYQDRDAGFYDFAVPSRQALEYFSNYVGPFVYEKLANIQSNSVGGGMEAASAILYGDDSVTGQRTPRWRYVIVHEIAHQWFGNSVTEANWDDVWLSEGFATYFSHLFYEHADGRDAFVSALRQARDRIFEFHADNPLYRIVHDNISDMSEVTTRQTYDKGAWILHMLRSKMGDEAWWEGIRAYYREYMNSNATTNDFRRHMEKACKCSLVSFFDQWLYQPGNVELSGTWHFDESRKSIEVSLTQVQESDRAFSIDVELGILGVGQLIPDVHTLEMTERSGQLSIPADARPERVLIDPQTALLAQWTFTENANE